MVKRRSEGEPVAYITGRRAFWNIELHVGPGVLVPRPDSEVLIASAIEHFEGGEGPKRILDLGTGPGTLLLAALDIWPEATGLGVDVSRQALSYASANARRLGFEPRVKLMQGNWAAGLVEKFDLILCNPPYVAEGAELGPGVREFEPDEALFAGREGLDAYRELAPQLPRLLSKGGLAAVEIGPDQADAVMALLARDGLQARVAEDLAGRPRAVLLTWV
jgi:release factor glutamine methyltransferase